MDHATMVAPKRGGQFATCSSQLAADQGGSWRRNRRAIRESTERILAGYGAAGLVQAQSQRTKLDLELAIHRVNGAVRRAEHGARMGSKAVIKGGTAGREMGAYRIERRACMAGCSSRGASEPNS